MAVVEYKTYTAYTTNDNKSVQVQFDNLKWEIHSINDKVKVKKWGWCKKPYILADIRRIWIHERNTRLHK